MSDSSAIVQGLSGTVILPGSVQATASQTIHLPSVVKVQASALAELGSPPVSQRQHKRCQGRRARQMPESDDIEMSAMRNVCSSNGVSTSKTRAEASANIVQVQLAGSLATELKSSRDSNMRSTLQGYNRPMKIHPERSVGDSCTCSEATPEQRSKRNPCKSCSRDSVINENARFATKDSIINENAVLFTRRGDSKSRTPTQTGVPRNVQIQVSANAMSNMETTTAMAECSSTQESVRAPSSRSSPGVESMGRASTLQSLQDQDTRASSQWSTVRRRLSNLSLSCFARDHYGPWLQQMPVKVMYIVKTEDTSFGFHLKFSL